MRAYSRPVTDNNFLDPSLQLPNTFSTYLAKAFVVKRGRAGDHGVLKVPDGLGQAGYRPHSVGVIANGDASAKRATTDILAGGQPCPSRALADVSSFFG